jgi:hypothetical protein
MNYHESIEQLTDVITQAKEQKSQKKKTDTSVLDATTTAAVTV